MSCCSPATASNSDSATTSAIKCAYAHFIAGNHQLCYTGAMFHSYHLDPKKLHAAAANAGLKSLAVALRNAGLHRNSINQYLVGKRSVFSSVTNKLAKSLNCDPMSLVVREELSTLKHDQVREGLINILSNVTAKYTDKHLCSFLFGSRARGLAHRNQAQPYSDWDIGISGGSNGLSTADYLQIKSQIQDLTENLPTKVDIVNFDSAPVWFLSGINYKLIFLAGNRCSFEYICGVLDGSKKSRENN